MQSVATNPTYTYRFDEEHKILYITFLNEMSAAVLINMGTEMIESGNVPEGTKRFIFDQRDTEYTERRYNFPEVIAFFRKYKDFFENVSIAHITHKTNQTAAILIVGRALLALTPGMPRMSLSPFFTIEAARAWLLARHGE